jgi:hypothetical protein
MLPIVSALLGNGLSLIANAVLAKGTAYVKEKTGIDLDKPNLSDKEMVSLKQFEMEHEEELMKLRLEENKLDAELTKLRLADSGSAREREARMAESPFASWLNRNTGAVLALTTIPLAFVLFYWVMANGVNVDGTHKDIIIYILGVLSAIVTQIFSYYFGSSTGSKSKSDDIARLMGKKGGQS